MLGVAVLLACRAPTPAPTATLSWGDALAALTDRGAVRGLRGRVRGASSHDPAGEDDRGRYLRSGERGGREEHVLLDEAGPGVLTRLWSANPERGGTLRIFLDGAERPWLEAPMDALLSGRGPVPPPLAATAGRGHVLLLPVPFAERLRVTIDRSTGKGLYWEASTLGLPEGVAAASPGPDALDDPALAAVAATLARPVDPAFGEPVRGAAPLTWTAPPGPGVVTGLRLSVPPDRLGALRLVVEVDGRTAIDVPAGALFGLGPRAAAVSTWWASADADGTLVSRWPMPYREGLTVRLLAEEPLPVGIAGAVGPGEPERWVFRGAHRDRAMVTRPAPTFLLAEARGPGVWVAETLWVENPSPRWWGQGDATLTVDGEVRLRGTGTEDHFGAAWCSHAPFSALLSAQATVDAPESERACEDAAGHAVYHRQRLLDAVPFEEDLSLALEVVHRAETEVRYRGSWFWYARE